MTQYNATMLTFLKPTLHPVVRGLMKNTARYKNH